MRTDNLLAVRFRRFILTTDSSHECQVHLNLAARMTLTGINQLWVADITYIRLRTEFVFLAIVIDRFSRKAIGWSLDRTLAARITVAALQQAITSRQPPPGTVHHSDQGIQYACSDYVNMLKANHIIPSMSRPANPYDNAACESFMKTLKQEEIYCQEYRDFDDLSGHLEEFMGYRTPEEFERDRAATSANGVIAEAATVRYFTPPPEAVPVQESANRNLPALRERAAK
jgi:transposase InsO family protein